MNIRREDDVIKTPDIQYDENCGGIGYTSFNFFKKYRERVAMIKVSTDEFWTYSEFLAKCIRTAIALKKQGYKRQDLLAICSNKENFYANVLLIAGQFLGLVTFSLDPKLDLNSLSELLKQIEPKILFVIDEAKELIDQALKINNANTKIVSFGKAFEDEYLKPQEDEDSFEPVFIQNLQDTCMIHFSSGSAGLPKPICLNHYYFLSLKHILNYLYLPELRREQFAGKPLGQVSLRFSNWYWVSSSIELVMYVQIGGCRILWDTFNAAALYSVIEKYSITNMFLTPLHYAELSSTIKPDEVITSSMKDIGVGGQSIPTETISNLRKIFPDVHTYQMYGMTETGLTTLFNSSIPRHLQLLYLRPSRSGLPVPGYSYKVIDIKTGEKCGPNKQGELLVKGKSLLTGIYNRDNSESFDEEGYLRTGDMVFFDEDFCMEHINRVIRIIHYREELICPRPIENVLLRHQSVQNAVVVGIPNEIDGEWPMGVVQLKPNAPATTKDDLVEYVNSEVGNEYRLRAGVLFMREFPLTITGKVDNMKIKEMAPELLANQNN